MKTKKVTLYIAYDGKEFDNKEECLKHESQERVLDYIRPRISPYDLSEVEVVEAILEKYAIIPQKKLRDYEALAKGLRELTWESSGIVGFLPDGEVAPWDKFLRGGDSEAFLGALEDLERKNYGDPEEEPSEEEPSEEDLF